MLISLDERTKEVLIDAKIIQVNLNDKMSFGIDWEYLLNKKLDNENWVGIRRLDFRWGVSRKLLADIEGGLNA